MALVLVTQRGRLPRGLGALLGAIPPIVRHVTALATLLVPGFALELLGAPLPAPLLREADWSQARSTVHSRAVGSGAKPTLS